VSVGQETPTVEQILEQTVAACSRDTGSVVKITGFLGEITVTATELHLAERCAAAERRAAVAEGALHLLNAQEVISAGRVRELLDMTPEVQRACWRAALNREPEER
jgi:hypothetical protein